MTEQGVRPAGPQVFRLGGVQFWLTILVLLGTILFLLAVWWPAIAQEYVEDVVLPGYETNFGFKGGRLTIQTSPGGTERLYGIVSVVPQGRLDRAGVKAGDVPLGYHGGANELCLALYKARRGEVASMQFRRASDWPNAASREVTIR